MEKEVLHLPEWIMSRYARLWLRFKDREFTRAQASQALGKDGALAVFLSELRKAGWLSMKMDEKDARRTIYRLADPKEAIMSEIKALGGGR